MTKIAQIVDYRERRSRTRVQAPVKTRELFVCAQCRGLEWMLCVDGEVRCAHCHAWAENVRVVDLELRPS